MSGFYRFPAMAKLDEYENMQQCAYICGEASEAIAACADMTERFRVALEVEGDATCNRAERARYDYGMELMDVIHAAETALRMEFSDSEVDQLWGDVELKNRERGYYGDELEVLGDALMEPFMPIYEKFAELAERVTK